MGNAVMGSNVTAIYASAMAGVDMNGVGAPAAQAARETIGDAVGQAAALGGEAGERLLAQAREAYAFAFQAVSVICAIVSALAGLVAFAILGRFQRGAAAESCPDGECPESSAA